MAQRGPLGNGKLHREGLVAMSVNTVVGASEMEFIFRVVISALP